MKRLRLLLWLLLGGAALFALLGSDGIATAYRTIENATTPLAQRVVLNFTGPGVSCADNAGASRTDCTINGTSGGGALVLGIVSKSAAYVFLPTDYAVDGDASGGSFSVKLEATPVTGQIHVLSKATAGNTLTLDGNGKNINGAATQPLTVQYTSYTVQYNGTEWRIE
jgi:hypothetical protein